MKGAHFANEMNPFASAFCAPYAWFSRKGHWLRSLQLLPEMSIGRGRLENCLSRQLVKAALLKFKSNKRIDRPLRAALQLHLAERIAGAQSVQASSDSL
jgi:hypothetical protein